MIRINNVQIICAALADQAAHEEAEGGIFTEQLLAALTAPTGVSLLKLPLDLDAWHKALPDNLLAAGVEIVDSRDALVGKQAGRGQAVPAGSPAAAPRQQTARA
jgi:hypothetical protein